MKKLSILIILMAAVVFRSAAQGEQLVVPLSEPGKPYSINVNLLFGAIKISAYEGKDIIIDAVPSGGEKKPASVNENRTTVTKKDDLSAGMKKISDGQRLSITAEEKGNKVSVNMEQWSRTKDLIIKIPQGSSSVKLSTINGGDIVAENLSGELEISNVNGSIYLNGITGSGVVNTINGNVKVVFKSINSSAPMAFTTLNGDVDVTFPATLKTDVKLKSDHGEIYTDFDIVIDKNQPKVNKSNAPGTYKVSIDQWIYGKISGGGPEVMMKNMHGNIYIRKAK